MVNVFDYTDFRKYLLDVYTQKKRANRAFSYRYIARRVGFRSPGFFGQIIKEQSNISLETARKIAAFLKLKQSETAYFEELVLFNQATTHAQRRASFEKLITYKDARITRISAEQYRLFERWFYYPIKCLIDIRPFEGDFGELAHSLVPPITPKQARAAIKALEELELIRKDEAGIYHSLRQHIVGDESTRSLAVNNYALDMIELSKQAIDRFGTDERLTSATTFNASPMAFALIRDEIRAFRSRVRSIVDADAIGEDSRVYQMNYQLFPLSCAPSSGEKKK
jgi:uncharacterized protein (TIGR02147 family)